jgi:hypothetical protein
MSVSFGRTTQNSFPSGSARIVQDSAPVCPMPARRPERKKAVDLLIAVRGAAGEVKMHAVLDHLGIGDRHEAHADGRVLVGPDDDLVLPLGQDLPAQRLRPETGQAGQIMSVHDDVVEPDGHAGSMRGTLDRIPGTRWSAADGPITAGHAAR